MIEFFVLIILIVAFALLLGLNLISMPTLLINTSIWVLLGLAILKDLKQRKMQAYYLVSFLITAIILISHQSYILRWFFQFLRMSLILEFSIALILVYAFAHITGLVHLGSQELIKKYKGFKRSK
jgi:hypothetical protein